MLAIPADAPHPDNAHAFLNFMMEPEVIAKVTNKVRFANGNAASLPFVDESIRNDPNIYPGAEVRARLHPDLAGIAGIQPRPQSRLDAHPQRPMSGWIRAPLVFAAAALSLAACGGEGDERLPAPKRRVLHVYNWVDYIGPTTIADFEARTGIRVEYDTYDSNEILETKMLTGRSGYDVVFPSGVPLRGRSAPGHRQARQVEAAEPRAHGPEFAMQRVAQNDPGNAHAIPYMWGTAGIGYNPQMVEKAIGTDRIDSWGAIFDPAIASRLAKCGIAMIDVPEDTLMAARIYLGLDPNSQDTEDLAAAEELLKRARPYFRYFNSSQLLNDLASGEVCVAFSWNGYIIQARARGAAAATPVEVGTRSRRRGRSSGSTRWPYRPMRRIREMRTPS